MVGIQRFWAFCTYEIDLRKIVSNDEENPMNVISGISIDDLIEDSAVSELKRTKIMHYKMWTEYPITLFLCVFYHGPPR